MAVGYASAKAAAKARATEHQARREAIGNISPERKRELRETIDRLNQANEYLIDGELVTLPAPVAPSENGGMAIVALFAAETRVESVRRYRAPVNVLPAGTDAIELPAHEYEYARARLRYDAIQAGKLADNAPVMVAPMEVKKGRGGQLDGTQGRDNGFRFARKSYGWKG